MGGRAASRGVLERGALRFRAERFDGSLVITIESVDDPLQGERLPQLDEVQGVTFEVLHNGPVELRLRGVGRIASTMARVGGMTFVGIPWQALALPSL
jgi:hypothetical protein